MNKYISRKLTLVNFILSFMIVSYHSYNVTIYFDVLISNPMGILFLNFQKYIHYIERLAVPMFFCISGYLFFRNYKHSMAIKKIQSRIKTLVIPYFIWNTISFIFYALITNIKFFSDKMNMSPVSLEFQDIITSICFGKYGPLWFIRILFCLVLLSPIIFYIMNKKCRAICLIVIIICSNILFPTNEYSLIYGSFFYCFGSLIALHYQDFIIKKTKKELSILMLLTLLISSVFIYNIYLEMPIFIRQLILLANVVIFWLAFDIFYYKRKIMQRNIYKLSFFIYCSHGIVLEVVEKLILIVLKKTINGAVIDYVLAPIITIMFLIVVAKILKKHFSVIWGVINGGR